MTPPPRPALATLTLTALLAFSLGTVPVSAQTTITYTDGQVDTTARSTSAPNDPTTLTIASGSATQSGEITGTGGLTKTGAGTLILAAANAYSGPTLIEAGELQFVIPSGGSTNLMSDITVNSGATLSVGSIYLGIGSLAGDGTVALGSNHNLGVGLNGLMTTFSGNITGSSGLYVMGGDLTLTGDNPDHTGTAVLFYGATLHIGAGGSTGSVRNVNLSTGTVIFNRSDDYTHEGAVTGSGDLVKEGANVLTLANGLSFYDSVSHVHVAAGTLRLGAYGTLANLIVDGGAVLSLNGFGATALTLTGAGTVQLSGSGLTVGSNYVDSVFTGTLTGAGPLTKGGTGTLTLGGAGTYTGVTDISAGRILLAADEVIGDGSFLSINVDGILDLDGHTETIARLSGAGQIALGAGRLILANDGTELYYMGAISGTGGLTLAGPGSLGLYGSNAFTGDTVLAQGTLVLGHAEALGGGGTIRFEGGALRFTEANHLDYSGRFSQAAGQRYAIDTAGNAMSLGTALTSDGGSLTKLGPGTLTLGGANTYTGATTISGGTLSLAGGGSLPAGTRVTVADRANFDLAGGNQVIAGLEGLGNVWLGAGQLTVNPGSGTSTFNGAVSGSGVLVKSGAGTLALGGLNTYTGGTLLEAGTLLLTYAGGLPFSGSLTFTGGTLRFTAATAFDFSGRFSPADNQSFRFDTNGQSLTFASALTSAGGTLTKLGAGTLTLGAANTYTGGTTLAGGTLSLAHAGALGASGPISFEGGTLQFTAANTADYSARFSAAAGQAYSIDTNGQSVTFASALTGAGGSLVKSGAGTLTLGGNNSYSGSTTVAGGTLLANGNSAAGTGALTVQSGATLGGNGYLAGPTTILSGGTLAPGNPGSPGTLTFANNADLILNSGSMLNFRLGTAGVAGGPTNDLVTGLRNLTLDGLFNVTGAPTFGAGSYRIFDYSGTLTDQTLDLGSLPFGFTYALQTNVANQVNLVATIAAGSTPFWDGSVTTGTGMITGGSGTWDNTTANFTSSDGRRNTAWDGALAIFAGSAGAVTLGESVSFTGMQFATTGYAITGSTDRYLNPSGAATIRTDPNVTTTIYAQMTGAGSLTKTDTGTLVLAAANTYTGGTTLAGGTLRLAHAGALGTSGPISFEGGTLQFTTSDRADYSARFSAAAGQAYSIDTNGQAVSFASGLTGAGATLTKLGAGTLTLGAANTYTGGTMLAGGTLSLAHAGALGGGGAIGFAGGTLQFTAANTTDYSARFSSAAAQAYAIDTNGQAVTFGAALTSAGGSLVKSGAGTLTLGGTNTFDGPTTVNAGTLAIGTAGSLASGSALSIAAFASFDLGNHAVTVGALSGQGAVAIGSGALTVGAGDRSSTFAGSMAGSGTLTKIGSGTLELTGVLYYTGGTRIDGGTLRGNLPDRGDLAVATGATYDLAGRTQSIGSFSGGGLVTLGSGSLVIGLGVAGPGSYSFTGSISGSGRVDYINATGADYHLTGNNTYTGGTRLLNGAIALGSAGALGDTGTLTMGGGVLKFTAANTTDYSARFSTIAGQRFNFDTNGQSVTLASPLISSGGWFDKTGAGTLTLAGRCSDDFIMTRITQGTLALGADNVLPDSGSFSINPGAILELGGHRDIIGSLNGAGEIKLGGGQLIINSAGVNSFVGGVISGAGTVTISGTGSLQLADNTYTGDTILAGGTLQLFRATGIGSTGQVRFEGGALDPMGQDISSRFSTASGQLYKFSPSYSTNVGTALTSVGGSFTKLGTATVTLLAANTYDGGTTISQGALQVGGGGTTGSITGNVVNNADLIFNRSNQVDFAGQISGTGRLVKRGAGELQLTSANNYGGGTLLQTGTLRVSNTTGSGLGTGAVNVSAGATLTGGGSFTGAVQLSGRISPGNSPGTLTTGSETWAGGASYLWEINNATGAAGTNWDLLTISGTLALAATPGSPFTIYVRSLDAGGAAAPAANFLAASDYFFVIATASGGITGFSADQFFIDTSGFANPAGGSWSVEALSGTGLQLHYSAGGAAVPEPAAAAALLGLLALGIVVAARRTCRRDLPR